MIKNSDQSEVIQQAVAQALKSKRCLQIIGGGSKHFYGRIPQGQPLTIQAHQGIVSYHPSELVVTVRAGTLLADLEKVLAEQKQMLAFEPPYFSKSATLGGVVACGLSGPRRPFTGAVRDFVLGCKLIDGKANSLSFGGEVMKNVAGYDVSRLMVGAMGTLGVLLEVSLKVLPKPVIENTQVFELNVTEAIERMQSLAKMSLPLSGLCFDGQFLYIRLSGAEKTVLAACRKMAGENLSAAEAFWRSCREQQHPFFEGIDHLWRISVPPATPEMALTGEWFYEWGGGQRWLKTNEPDQAVFDLANKMQGHAVLFKTKDRTAEVFQPLSEALKKLHKNLKTSFDPEAIFNPCRIYKDW